MSAVEQLYSADIVETQRARGLATSEENARSVVDPPIRPELAWCVRFKLPFSSVASKNAIYGRVSDKKHRVFMRSESRKYRDAIAILAKQALGNFEVKHDKVWLDIFVEKAQHKSDAINVIDLVCDAIKQVIPVDDRWYSIRSLDWSINKVDPYLFIGIGQEFGAADSRVCSYCGLIRPLTDFTNDRSNQKGKGHVCIGCRAPSYPKGPNKKYRD